MTSFRGQAFCAKMIFHEVKLTALACHPYHNNKQSGGANPTFDKEIS